MLLQQLASSNVSPPTTPKNWGCIIQRMDFPTPGSYVIPHNPVKPRQMDRSPHILMEPQPMDFDNSLQRFNDLPHKDAYAEFLRCCGSPAWAEVMTRHRPYSSVEVLLDKANTLWWSLLPEEWLKAFAAHPKIGDSNALRKKFAHSSWEGQEQSGANSADEATLQGLATLNEEYLQRNGFIFLICATGKSAKEMLDALRVRLGNDSATEMQVAAGEQNKITKLRVFKLLEAFSQGECAAKL